MPPTGIAKKDRKILSPRPGQPPGRGFLIVMSNNKTKLQRHPEC